MNVNEFKRIVDSINAVLTEGLSEHTGHFEDCKQWLEEVNTELSKPKRKSCFLVPKTPTASRKPKKRTRQPAEPSLEEQADSVHNASMSSSYNTRKKRPALQDTNLGESVDRPRREASKVANNKIKNLGKETSNSDEKIHQDFGGKCSADSTVKRMSETEIAEESQRPSKNRRLDETFQKLTVSICDISSLSVLHQSSSIDHDKCVEDSTRKKSNSFAIDSNNPDTLDFSNNLTFNVDTTVCSSICKENNLTFNINVDSIKHSSICADVHTTVNHETPIKEQNKKNTKSNKNKKSETSELTPGTSLLAEQKYLETLSNSDAPSIIQNTPKHVPNVDSQTLVEHKTLEFDSALATLPSGQNPSNPSDVLVNGGEKISKDTIPILKDPVVILTDVMNTISPNDKVISPILSNAKGSSKYGYKNSPSAKEAKSSMKKTTEVFSPYAKEPVRERVAAFERLNTLSEVTQEEETEQVQPQMRVTRTKTRAMAKAAAAAEASAKNDFPDKMEPNNDPSKNIYSQNAWKAARKSLAKAIVRTTKKKKYGTIGDPEMSKENSMVLSSSRHFTPHYRTTHHTPLSSSNISNTSANSASRLFNFGSSSKPKHMMGKSSNIVVGVDTFISKRVCKSTINEMRELKEEGIKRKQEREEEARRKRDEAMKKCIEERKRKREERMKKVAIQREAIEKQKLDAEIRQQKEKDEKLKLAMQEREDRIKEQKQQKKQQAQQKAAEIEERRKLEEITRLAKLKDQEEEQAAKKKELEEIMRKETHEKDGAFRDKQAKLIQLNAQLQKEKQLRLEEKMKMLPPKGVMSDMFEVPSDKKVPNPNNYEIDSSGTDSSEDETDSKRPIPHWARRDQRSPALKALFYVNKELLNPFFTCSETTPNIMALFKEFTTVRQIVRSSSAVWRTPPRYSRLPRY